MFFQKNKQKSHAPFLISDLRFKEETKQLETPGPGTYEHPKTVKNLMKSGILKIFSWRMI